MDDYKADRELLEPFQIALKLEQEGRQFFLECAEKAKSALVRNTFEFLASEEDQHIERIEKFYNSLKFPGSDELPDVEESNADSRMEKFNEELVKLKDDYSITDSDAEAYRVAMKFENGAEIFYDEQMQGTSDPRIKKFYKWLIDEEAMHERLLKSCLQFALDPADWFKRHSKI